MQKGKYGVCLWFYALVAFILAFLGQVLLGGLLLGFVIVAEKNEWLTRQVIQAFFLTIIVSVINAVLDLLNIFGNVPIVGTAIGVVFNVISTIVSIVVLVFVIIAMVKVVKGQEANMPLLSKLANRAYGIIEKKVYTQAAPANYAQPQAPQAPQVPVQPQAPQAPKPRCSLRILRTPPSINKLNQKEIRLTGLISFLYLR